MIDNKILFILAPKIDVTMPPISVPCLSAYLKVRNWDVIMYDLNIECYANRSEKYLNHWNAVEFQGFWTDPNSIPNYFKDNSTELQKMMDFIEKEEPAYIGFSTWITNILGCKFIAKEIKKKWPAIKIIFGGIDVLQKSYSNSIDPESFSAVDVFVFGEGEETLHKLLNIFRSGGDFSQLPGIAYFKDNKLYSTATYDTIVPPQDLPMPDFHYFDFKKYLTQGTQLPFYLSRGCINKCMFCEERTLWKTFRTKSGKQVFDEIKKAKEMFPDFISIYFSESLTNGSISKLREFCLLLIESKMKIDWSANVVVRKEMDADLLKLMAAAGCNLLMYGTETASKRLLEYVGKISARDADISKIVKDTSEAGINVTLNFMFGLPGETEEDAQENIDFVIKNKQYIYTIYPSWSFCYLTQFCSAFKEPEKWGLKPITSTSFWESIDGSNTYPIRLERFERFCTAMKREGIAIQYPAEKLLDREKQLGYYYCHKKDFRKASEYLIQAIEKEPENISLKNSLENCLKEIK